MMLSVSITESLKKQYLHYRTIHYCSPYLCPETLLSLLTQILEDAYMYSGLKNNIKYYVWYTYY